MESKPAIVLFDFDGTITTRDTLWEVLKFTRGKNKFYIGLCILSPVLLLFKVGIIPAKQAKEMVLTFFLKGMRLYEFNNLCERFIEDRLPKLLRKSAIDVLAKHIAHGHCVVVVSASLENWVLPWCSVMGIQCIATKMEEREGIITGRINGENCNGKVKDELVRQRYDLSRFAEILAYGNSKKDFAMLALADRCYYRIFR